MTERPREIRTVDMEPKQLDAYVELAEQILHNGVNPFHPDDNLLHLTWLSLYASATGSLDENRAIVLSRPSSKAQVLFDLVEGFDDVPTVVFTVSTQVLEVARASLRPTARKLVASEMHDGAVTKGKGIEAFANGTRDVLVTTTHRYIGLTYPRARRAVFLQRPWSDGAVTWIEGALPDDCEIVTYVSAGTVECLQPHNPNRLDQLAAATTPDTVYDLIYGRER